MIRKSHRLTDGSGPRGTITRTHSTESGLQDSGIVSIRKAGKRDPVGSLYTDRDPVMCYIYVV